MKKYLSLLILCPVLCFGQEKEYTGTIIKLCPAISPLPFPAIHLSVEQKLSKDFAIQVETGYGFGMDIDQDSIFVKPLGLKFNTEIRYYFDKKRTNLYVGFNAFYRYERRNKTLIYTPHYDSSAYLDGVTVTNNSAGLALVLGFQPNVKSFVLNPFVNVGVLYRDVKNTHREYDPARGDGYGGDGYPHYFFRERYYSEYSGYKPYFSIGLRLGYAFRKNKPSEKA